MAENLTPGDYLIFQIESGYGLLRLLDIEEIGSELVWHLTAYSDLFLDTETAEAALKTPENLMIALPHAALSNRAFESTQVAKMGNSPLTAAEADLLAASRNSAGREVHDRSIRLLLGLR